MAGRITSAATDSQPTVFSGFDQRHTVVPDRQGPDNSEISIF